jgi:hypothetical protein
MILSRGDKLMEISILWRDGRGDEPVNVASHFFITVFVQDAWIMHPVQRVYMRRSSCLEFNLPY